MSAINQEINALIQADIDGVLADQDRARLQGYLDGSDELRAYYAECRRLCEGLDGLELLEPPAGLAASVLAGTVGPVNRSNQEETGSAWQALIAAWSEFPVLRYAAAFLLGAVVFSSVSRIGLDERRDMQIDGLVGTISSEPVFGSLKTLSLDSLAVQGEFEILRTPQVLQLRFDLASEESVDLTVNYDDQAFHLLGFSQNISEVSSLSASTGEIVLTVHGDQGFTIFLKQHDSLDQNDGTGTAIELQISRDGVSKSLAIPYSEVTTS